MLSCMFFLPFLLFFSLFSNRKLHDDVKEISYENNLYSVIIGSNAWSAHEFGEKNISLDKKNQEIFREYV